MTFLKTVGEVLTTILLPLLQFYLGGLSASVRRKSTMAEIRERIKVTQEWNEARLRMRDCRSEDAERLDAELLYSFQELERTRVKRARGDVIWPRKVLLLYDVKTDEGRFFRSWAFYYSLLLPLLLIVRTFTLWLNPNHPLTKNWYVIFPPHLLTGPWTYWLVLAILIFLGNLAETFSRRSKSTSKLNLT